MAALLPGVGTMPTAQLRAVSVQDTAVVLAKPCARLPRAKDTNYTLVPRICCLLQIFSPASCIPAPCRLTWLRNQARLGPGLFAQGAYLPVQRHWSLNICIQSPNCELPSYLSPICVRLRAAFPPFTSHTHHLCLARLTSQRSSLRRTHPI